MTVARALVGFAFGFLLATSAVYATAGWRAGTGCLACAAVGFALGFDVDRVTRKSRWQENDSRRAALALLEAANRGVPAATVMVSIHPSWVSAATEWSPRRSNPTGPVDYVHDPGHHNTLLDKDWAWRLKRRHSRGA